jgi:RNA polymerase sigma-70 factor (ECF subfamily)
VRPKRSEDEDALDGAAEVDEALDQAVLRWQVTAALGKLSPQHREVIRLAHYGGLTMREIAEKTGVPIGTVKSRTSYALRHLRLIFDEMEIEP